MIKRPQDRLDQQLCDAAVPEVRENREGAHKPYGSPSGAHIGPHQTAVHLCAECGCVFSIEAGADKPPVQGVVFRVRYTEECAEGNAEYLFRILQVVFSQRTYMNIGVLIQLYVSLTGIPNSAFASRIFLSS